MLLWATRLSLPIDNHISFRYRTAMPKKKPHTKPTRCIEPFPGDKTVYFAGEFIRVRIVSLYSGLAPSTISKVLSGRLIGKLSTLIKMAEALGMDVPYFLDAINERHEIAERYDAKWRREGYLKDRERLHKMPHSPYRPNR